MKKKIENFVFSKYLVSMLHFLETIAMSYFVLTYESIRMHIFTYPLTFIPVRAWGGAYNVRLDRVANLGPLHTTLEGTKR